MSDRVKVLIADDPDYEDLIAEVLVDGDCVAILSQEEGFIVVEIDHTWIWQKGPKRLPLAEYKQALEQAEARLRQMKKP